MKLWSWIGLVLVLGLVACGPSKEAVQAAIDEANTCQADSDCASAGSQCPFGCSIPVHKGKVSTIKALVEDYQKSTTQVCAYDCLALDKIVCENNKCVAKYQE